MKKYLFSVLAVLMMAGTVWAHSFAIDPKTEMAVQTIPVYNNASADLDVGDVVVWDIDASTGDNDAYVTTTTTADTHLVAGVVWPSAIADGDVGSIAIYGLVTCDLDASGVGEAGPLCTGATAGAASACENNDAKFGHAVVAIGASSSGNCFVNP